MPSLPRIRMSHQSSRERSRGTFRGRFRGPFRGRSRGPVDRHSTSKPAGTAFITASIVIALVAVAAPPMAHPAAAVESPGTDAPQSLDELAGIAPGSDGITGEDEIIDPLGPLGIPFGSREVIELDDGRLLVPFGVVGLPATFAMPAPSAERGFRIELPAGLVVDELWARAQIPLGMGNGTLEVLANGDRIGVVSLVEPTDAQLTTPIRLPIPETDGEPIDLTLRSRIGEIIDVCDERLAIAPLLLQQAALVVRGDAIAPQTLAESLPRILQQVTIHVDNEPTINEATTVLRLTTDLVARFSGLPLKIDLVGLDRRAPLPLADPNPLSRNIVVRDIPGEANASLVTTATGPIIVLQGDERALVDQAALLDAQIGLLAQAGIATADGGRVRRELQPISRTFEEFGIGSPSVTGVGRTQLPVIVDLTRLRGPIAEIDVRLDISSTPLATNESGSVTLAVRGETLATQPLSGTGSDILQLTIPGRLVDRATALELTIDHSPQGGACSPGARPLSVQFVSSSEIAARVVEPNMPGFEGFRALPHRFQPSFDVELHPLDLQRLRYAQQVVHGLQTLTGTAMLPTAHDGARQVDDRAEFAMRPRLIVRDSGAPAPFIGEQLFVVARNVYEVRGIIDASIELQGPLAILQSMTDLDGAPTLLVTSEDDALLERMLWWLEAEPGRWFGLDGDTVVLGAGSTTPQVLTLRPSAPLPDTQRSFLELITSVLRNTITWILGLPAAAQGIAVAVIGIVTVIGIRWLRRPAVSDRGVGR